MVLKTRTKKITGTHDVAKVFNSILACEHEVDRDKEHFWAIGLDTAHRVKYVELISLGLLDSCQIHPREVFRFAVMHAVGAIIVCHNHPSGIAEPSPQDIEITGKLREAGEVLGIKVLDHVIIGSVDNYYSLAENGQ